MMYLIPMTDRLTPERRSWNMRRVPGKNTRQEIIVRSLLHRMGFRFTLHSKDLPGKPDIVLPKYHTVIFVHGCFWHQHENCIDGRLPKSNLDFWEPKLTKNKNRDQQKMEQLKSLGWKVITLWECQIEKDLDLIRKYLIEELHHEL